MFGKFKSLKSRLIFFFLIFTGITAVVAFAGVWHYGKAGRLSQISSQLDRVLINVLQILKYEQDFFTAETINPEYFQKGQSEYKDMHDALVQQVKDNLYQLLRREEMKELNVDQNLVKEDIKNIIYELESYENNFLTLINLIRKRGFKDDGLEGRMRGKIHTIENMDDGIPKIDMLTLRRHEKDYIIRKDKKYAKLHREKVEEVLKKLNQNQRLGTDKRQEIYDILQGYGDDFQQLVKIEDEIGITYKRGKKGQMRNHADHVSSLMNTLLKKINTEIFIIRNTQIKFFYGIIITAVILSLFLSYYLAGKITKPIFKLSIAIQHIVEKNFEGDLTIVNSKSADEIGELTTNFNAMLIELKQRIDEIKEQNHELELQNEELNVLNNQLNQSEEKLQNIIKVKNKFFSIISHDLREPLSSVMIFMRTLENKSDLFTPEELKDFAIENQKSLNRVIELLENLLQWSLSQSGELKYKPEALSINAVIQENLNLYQSKAKKLKNIDIIFHPEEEYVVEFDKNMLNFVLRNLLTNAIKFSFNDSEVHIATKSRQNTIELSIQDQGLGMSESIIQKVLDEGEHLSTVGTNQEKGTGFGLILSKTFVEKNGGRLQIESQEGKGTKVWFIVKKVLAPAPEQPLG